MLHPERVAEFAILNFPLDDAIVVVNHSACEAMR